MGERKQQRRTQQPPIRVHTTARGGYYSQLKQIKGRLHVRSRDRVRIITL